MVKRNCYSDLEAERVGAWLSNGCLRQLVCSAFCLIPGRLRLA